MTSSNPNYIPKAPSPNAITLTHRGWTYEFWWDTTFWSITDNFFPSPFLSAFFVSAFMSGCHRDPCLWIYYHLPIFYFNDIIYAHSFNYGTQTPHSYLYIFSPQPCFNLIFQNIFRKIQVNEIASPQISCVLNWAWHLFVCPNSCLNLSSVKMASNHFCFFFLS